MKLMLLQAKVDNRDSCGSPKTGDDRAHRIGLFVDNETGVEYFVMNIDNAGAICPRLDRNGKPVIYQPKSR